ncbi:hypothetical protein GEV33_004835 [Tenebrio molitor]|uniref:Uncharacterized protein n=1 Tax=Tenebrio molitor TaxID=7067 RepID=A0A8J6LE71_TENMO|nr:hypothetical protein GEV33_004835 [Tenebrio molitor]
MQKTRSQHEEMKMQVRTPSKCRSSVTGQVAYTDNYWIHLQLADEAMETRWSLWTRVRGTEVGRAVRFARALQLVASATSYVVRNGGYTQCSSLPLSPSPTERCIDYNICITLAVM